MRLPEHTIQLTTLNRNSKANLVIAMILALFIRADNFFIHILGSKTTILVLQWLASFAKKCGR
jgi:hypothetical protein